MPLDRLIGSDSSARRLGALAFALVGTLMVAPGCSSNDASPNTGMDGGGDCPAGTGPVMGQNPDSCMGKKQDIGTCMTSGGDDAGGGDTDGGGGDTFPTPSYGTASPDDDCKYDVSFTNDCVMENGPGTTFFATLMKRADGMPGKGSTETYIEAFIGNHPADTGSTNAKEISEGVYQFAPVKFDQKGRWTVRFHFFGNCSDEPEDSPHAHAAFFIDVP